MTKNASQIGLIYATDYVNAYQNKSADNWLFITNGWNGNASNYEWTMSSYGRDSSSDYHVWGVYTSGTLTSAYVTGMHAVRPVFYVDPIITLTGKGIDSDPFIIHSA